MNSDVTSFQVTLYNLNYKQSTDYAGVESKNQAIDTPKSGDSQKKQLIGQQISALNANQTTKANILTLLDAVGFEQIFGRTDISQIIGITVSPAGELIKKLKTAGLIDTVRGHGKGKYKFIEPKE